MRSSYIGQGRDERAAHGEAERNHPLTHNTHNTHTTRVRAGGHKQRTEPRELRRSCVRATPRGVGVRVLNRPSELLGKRQQVRNGAGANANALPAGRVAKTSGRGEEVPAERGAASERSSSSHMRTLASTRATRGSRRRHRRDEHPRARRAALDEGGNSGRRLALTAGPERVRLARRLSCCGRQPAVPMTSDARRRPGRTVRGSFLGVCV